MSVHVVHSIGDLERDMREITTSFKPLAAARVRDSAKKGNSEARRLARRSAAAHGKYYFRSITLERVDALTYVYGPEAGLPQGGMSFERGSRNQKPHLDLAQSADLLGEDLERGIDRVIDGLFW